MSSVPLVAHCGGQENKKDTNEPGGVFCISELLEAQRTRGTREPKHFIIRTALKRTRIRKMFHN